VLLFTALEGLSRRPRAVAIGTFDGLHIGHQQVIGGAVAAAREAGLTSSVLTFSGHPAAVLDPSHRPRLLTPLPVKVQLIDALGPDELLLLPFDRALAATTADEFCRRILVAALQAQVVVVGENYTYGAGGAAGAAELRAAGEALGFAIANLITLFAPPKVIISGRAMATSEFFIGPLRETVSALLPASLSDVSEIVVREWSEGIWVRGAAAMTLRDLYGAPWGTTGPAPIREALAPATGELR
jgi:hypothetical protein